MVILPLLIIGPLAAYIVGRIALTSLGGLAGLLIALSEGKPPPGEDGPE